MSAGGSPFLLPTLTTPSIWKVKQYPKFPELKKWESLTSVFQVLIAIFKIWLLSLPSSG